MQTMFSHREMLLSPCNDFHDRVLLFFNETLLEWPKTVGLQYWFSVLHRYLSLLLRTSASLSCSFYSQSYYWTVASSLNCLQKMFRMLFLFRTTYFFSLFFALFQIFYDLLLLSNSKWSNIFNEIVKCLALKKKIYFLCSVINKIWVYEIFYTDSWGHWDNPFYNRWAHYLLYAIMR